MTHGDAPMKLLFLFFLILLYQGCSSNRGTSECATSLSYVPNINTNGQDAISNASVYYANIMTGSEDFFVKAKIDTGSSHLVINEGDYLSANDSRIGKKPYIFKNPETKSIAVNALDSFNLGCASHIVGKFSLTSGALTTPNILGLAFGDAQHLPHEAKIEPFFDQLVRKNGFNNVISLALCGPTGNSHVLLGGIDDVMTIGIGKFIPIIEKSAYVVPALIMRRADNKKFLGAFPKYDPESKTGRRTILDSGTAFNMLPVDMAVAMTREVMAFAEDKNLNHLFPEGFFRTERSISTKVARFSSLLSIRQFPTFEISFYGVDGKTKSLELSPLYYFKQMDVNDPLVRTYATRDTGSDIILGQPFLENHYVVFDRNRGMVGFGNINVACQK